MFVKLTLDGIQARAENLSSGSIILLKITSE